MVKPRHQPQGGNVLSEIQNRADGPLPDTDGLKKRGYDEIGEVLSSVLNVAMRVKREKALGARPYTGQRNAGKLVNDNDTYASFRAD